MLLLLPLLLLPLVQGEDEGRVALQEEVNVLLYGTLQLGQALSDTYSSTASKLQKVMSRHNRQENSLQMLREQSSRAKSEEERLRREVNRLQQEEHEVQMFSRRIERELWEVRRGYRELQKKVQHLEEEESKTKAEGAATLKTKTERQNLILQVVMEVVTQQQAQMAKQRQQLHHILRKVSSVH
ncbi:golgin subfamily A member 6-like protein 22 isoform X2 [Xenopus laevis]|uniref:Golgin subfamily A member 6-like protein 22 isoform X2 n=2 Tax=Xenopus laevis TaxID=8355 RepID=A0A8J0U712_XENLA|nr:golgin subfamily A member 6-like protein 22 isoform X2 [Xenopus laevis]